MEVMNTEMCPRFLFFSDFRFHPVPFARSLFGRINDVDIVVDDSPTPIWRALRLRWRSRDFHELSRATNIKGKKIVNYSPNF